VLSPSKIVVIAADAGLRHSLAFALEVEGYQVDAHETWVQCSPYTGCLCRIIDDQVIQNSSEALQYVSDNSSTVILLADGLSAAPPVGEAMILLKPFVGADLVSLVRSLTCAA
jgi:hypothetical protein